MATDEADSDNKFSPGDYGEEDKENNEADVEFEFEMKSDSDSDRLRPGCHRSDTTVNSALFISLKVSPSSTSFGQPRIRTIRCRRRNPRAPEARAAGCNRHWWFIFSLSLLDR